MIIFQDTVGQADTEINPGGFCCADRYRKGSSGIQSSRRIQKRVVIVFRDTVEQVGTEKDSDTVVFWDIVGQADTEKGSDSAQGNSRAGWYRKGF